MGISRTLLALIAFTFLSACPALAVTPPTISPDSATSAGAVSVSMSADSGDSIFFTQDGTDPSNSSTPFASSISISSPTEIRAIAYNSSTATYSSVSTAFIDVDPEYAPLLSSDLLLRIRAGFGTKTGLGNPRPVLFAADLSGNHNDATASESSAPRLEKYPERADDFLFNGAEFFALPTGFADFTNGITLFAVLSATSSDDEPVLDLGLGALGSDVLLQTGTASGGARFRVFHDLFDHEADSAVPLTRQEFQLLEAVQSPGSSSALGAVLLMGDRGASNNSMFGAQNVTRTSNFIGHFSAPGGINFHGRLRELLVYKTEMTVDQRRAIRESLIRRFRLDDALPEAPVMSVPSGSLTAPTYVAISAPRGCGIIHFTDDGSDPTIASPIYTKPLWINFSRTLKAIFVRDHVSSSISSESYSLNSTSYPAPSESDTTAPTINFDLPTPNQ